MDDQQDLNKVIERLLLEVRQYREQIAAVQYALNKGGFDAELLTLVGAVNKLIQDKHEATERAFAAEKALVVLKKR